MTAYISRRDNLTQIKVIKYDERFMTYMVEFINGGRVGETATFSSSTMKRWWKKIEVEEPSSVKDECENSNSEKNEEKVDMLDYVVGIIDGKLTYKRSGRLMTVYKKEENKKRLCYLYKRKNCVRVYMLEKNYTKISDTISDFVYNDLADKNEHSFYIHKEHVKIVFEEIIRMGA